MKCKGRAMSRVPVAGFCDVNGRRILNYTWAKPRGMRGRPCKRSLWSLAHEVWQRRIKRCRTKYPRPYSVLKP
jgi:hypothetical protein